MRAKFILRAATVAAITLIALTSASFVFGCVPEDEDFNDRHCAKWPKKVATPLTPQPKGDNPADAMIPDGNWRFAGPHSSVWYKIDDGGLHLEIWLDTNGQNGLSLAIYAPDQKDLDGKPVGRGSFNKFQPHDLFWSGRTSAHGIWYAVVANANPYAFPYSLNYQRVRKRAVDQCAVCHGQISVFEGCEPPDSAHCTNLKEELESK